MLHASKCSHNTIAMTEEGKEVVDYGDGPWPDRPEVHPDGEEWLPYPNATFMMGPMILSILSFSFPDTSGGPLSKDETISVSDFWTDVKGCREMAWNHIKCRMMIKSQELLDYMKNVSEYTEEGIKGALEAERKVRKHPSLSLSEGGESGTKRARRA